MCFEFSRVQPIHRGMQQNWCSEKMSEFERHNLAQEFSCDFVDSRFVPLSTNHISVVKNSAELALVEDFCRNAVIPPQVRDSDFPGKTPNPARTIARLRDLWSWGK